MATAPINRPRRETVEFPPNVPVTVALKYAHGKVVPGQYGERLMFSTTDGRVLFVSAEVAGSITSIGVNVNEPFTITKRVDSSGSILAWDVARLPIAAAPPKPAIPATAASSRDEHRQAPPSESPLITEANALVDAYAEVLDRALRKHEGRVKPDEVRALLISSYIQRRQLSSVA